MRNTPKYSILGELGEDKFILCRRFCPRVQSCRHNRTYLSVGGIQKNFCYEAVPEMLWKKANCACSSIRANSFIYVQL